MMDIDFFQCEHTLNDMRAYLHTFVKHKYKDGDSLQIFEALELASSAHSMQLRSDSIPFVIHPIRVALMLLRFDRNVTAKVLIAALLHDVLEDTDLTLAMIEKRFGRYVAQLVQAVTRHHKKTTDLQEKREDKRQHWEEVICDDHEVRAIKTFEDLDNMIYWKAIPVEDPNQNKISRWLEEAQEMSLPLARATNLQAYNMMKEVLTAYVTQDYVAQSTTM